MTDLQIIPGHVLAVLKQMPSESVQCAITSPPYYGLRSYGTEPQIWGGDEFCDHVWGVERIKNTQPARDVSGGFGGGRDLGTRGVQGSANAVGVTASQGNFCQTCNAWRGELGLEPDFKLYIAHLIEIFAEVKRVLKPDGTCFVNLGDSYSGDSPVRSVTSEQFSKTWDASQTRTNGGNRRSQVCSVPRKSLMNIPARFAIAMTDELQFIQRNELIWFKRACMPSSAKDRFTVDFEPIFMFSKNQKYKFNQQLEPHLSYEDTAKRTNLHNKGTKYEARSDMNDGQRSRLDYFNPEGRNKRCVWDVPFEPQSDSHYASYPTKLVEPMILAGTDEGDTVLDIFAGTGTTLLTAIRHRRKGLGIELQPKYIEIAERRLKEIQVNLF